MSDNYSKNRKSKNKRKQEEEHKETGRIQREQFSFTRGETHENRQINADDAKKSKDSTVYKAMLRVTWGLETAGERDTVVSDQDRGVGG